MLDRDRPPLSGARVMTSPRNSLRMASPRNSSAMLAASMSMGSSLANLKGGRNEKMTIYSEGSADLSGLSSLDIGGEDEGERLRKKRLAIFKSKYEVDEKIVSRNKALVNLVKSLGRTNLRQAEEIVSLKDRVSQLEDYLSRLQPLEALLAYMQTSSDDKVLSLLASDGNEPPPTAGAPTLPPSEVMERLVTLLQTCGEGVDDLGPDILQSEARACDMAAAGDEGWVEEIESAEREAIEEFRCARRKDGPHDAKELVRAGDEDDVFEAEIAAIGTHLVHTCTQCGVNYTEQSNTELACRWHPGIKKVDASWNSVWTCCNQKHAMRGCSVGRHLPSLGDDDEQSES